MSTRRHAGSAQKSFGVLDSPTDSYNVRRTMEGVRIAHGGTALGCKKAALAIQPGMLQMLCTVANDMCDVALSRGDYRVAYGHARDALWYVLAFLGCLRREEAVAVRLSDVSPGQLPGTFRLFVKKSKNDQAQTGVSLPMSGTTDSGISLSAQLRRLDIVLKAWGKEGGGVLFGNMSNPAVPLASAASILDRLMEVYVPEMAARGLEVPDSFRYSGHSFRRGGINAIRDAARRVGIGGEELRSSLLTYGRWRDPRSLEAYLAEDIITLTQLTQRV